MIQGKRLSCAELRKLQLIQTELIVQLDALCRKYDIKYVIACGTMLGAYRHKGFIPWDDDGDICMLREEYEKFKRVTNELDPEICWFQDHTTDPDYPWGYGKLRKTGTTYVRAGDEHLKAKTGVYIDIFPMDDLPKGIFTQTLDAVHCWIQRNILYANIGKYSAKGLKKACFNLLSLIPAERVLRSLDKRAKRSRNDTENEVRLLMYGPMGKYKRKFPFPPGYGMKKSWFLDRSEYDFEGHKVYGSRDYDGLLTFLYQNYMQLPPEEKRGPSAPPSSYEF